jgi:hypothetical protein
MSGFGEGSDTFSRVYGVFAINLQEQIIMKLEHHNRRCKTTRKYCRNLIPGKNGLKADMCILYN